MGINLKNYKTINIKGSNSFEYKHKKWSLNMNIVLVKKLNFSVKQGKRKLYAWHTIFYYNTKNILFLHAYAKKKKKSNANNSFYFIIDWFTFQAFYALIYK